MIETSGKGEFEEAGREMVNRAVERGPQGKVSERGGKEINWTSKEAIKFEVGEGEGKVV